jgi:tetratricopeptide (TPR) repeat protein
VALWADADAALYGRKSALPDDWVLRAETALAATHVPAWHPLSLCQTANLLPWLARSRAGVYHSAGGKVATVVLLTLLFAAIRSPAFAAAEEAPTSPTAAPKSYAAPRAAYHAGDFGVAEQDWREVIGRDPADWVARHNLALALAQQGHWPEAAAQWTSAFLLNPRDESVRWHLALGYERAEYTPPGFGEFAVAAGPHLLARLASPAEWQWLLVMAGVMLAAALLLLLVRGYRTVSNNWMRPTALTISLLAFLVAVGALMSLRLYGETADPRAAIAWHQVLLRSIPTEADTQQKTSSLPAGSLAIVNKEFLGWVRLAFANGQTGWVRQQDIVWLYR